MADAAAARGASDVFNHLGRANGGQHARCARGPCPSTRPAINASALPSATLELPDRAEVSATGRLADRYLVLHRSVAGLQQVDIRQSASGTVRGESGYDVANQKWQCLLVFVQIEVS